MKLQLRLRFASPQGLGRKLPQQSRHSAQPKGLLAAAFRHAALPYNITVFPCISRSLCSARTLNRFISIRRDFLAQQIEHKTRNPSLARQRIDLAMLALRLAMLQPFMQADQHIPVIGQPREILFLQLLDMLIDQAVDRRGLVSVCV